MGRNGSIWYFSKDNIWTAGIPKHWNGKEWKHYHLWDMGVLGPDDGGVDYIWASSPDDIYFVGWKGSIVHYDGKNFSKMESGTDVDLRGIWGLDKDHIWVVGTTSVWKYGIILKKNKNNWETIHYTEPGDRKVGRFYSVWTDNDIFLYLNGVSGRYIYNLITNELTPFKNSGEWMGEGIMGTSSNDIFVCNGGSEVLHYNRVRWYSYRDIKRIFGEYGVFTCLYVTKSAIVIGGFYPTLRWLPIVLRGYR